MIIIMRKKRFEKLCKKIAIKNQIRKNELIEHRTNLTQKDITQINIRTKMIKETIIDYRPITTSITEFNQLLRQLIDITQYIYYTPKLQKQIIKLGNFKIKNK